MIELHITQCEDGCWMLSSEEAGRLRRITSDHLEQGHLVQDALEMVANGKYPGATVIIEAPWVLPDGIEARESMAPASAESVSAAVRPAPRRARQ